MSGKSLMDSLWHINAPKCRPTGIRWGFAWFLSADHCITRFMGLLRGQRPHLRHGCNCCLNRWQADRKCYCNMLVWSAKKYAKYLIMNCVRLRRVCTYGPADKPRDPTGPLSIVAIHWQSLVRFNEFSQNLFFCFLFSISRGQRPFHCCCYPAPHTDFYDDMCLFIPFPLLTTLRPHLFQHVSFASAFVAG